MPSFAFDNSSWREQLLAYLPTQVKSLVQGASGRDLIKKIDACFLLHGDRVVHLESREMLELAQEDAESVAAACARILAKLSTEQQKDSTVLLLLPAKYFVATTTRMPGITKESLSAALRIQSDSILPSCEEALSLAINADSANHTEEHLALWASETTLTDFFVAFEAKRIFLAAIKPRLLNVTSGKNDGTVTTVVDVDDNSETCAVVGNGVVRKWLHVHKQDLQQEVFREQWQQSLLANSPANSIELHDVRDFLSFADTGANQDYCFFAKGALNATRKTEKGKRTIAAAVAALAMLAVAAMPFILQSLEFRSLAKELELQRNMATDAQQNQAVVVGFENEWGAISDFPEQRIREAMFTLQNVLRPDSLTSLELSEGLIKIQGISSEPQAILQRLEQDPMFTEVIFSRATNNSRYYIDLHLSTVDFEGYMVRYFPDE